MSYGHGQALDVASGPGAYHPGTYVPAVPEAPASTILAATERDIYQNNGRLADILGRMAQLRARAFGPEPEATGSIGQNAKAAGAVYSLSETIGAQTALIGNIESALTDIERLV